MNKKGFTVIEILASFSIALTILIVLFNVVIIMKDNLGKVNAMTNTLVEKDNLSYNINKRLKEKELASLTVCEDGDKCYLFTYSDSTSDKLVYSATDKSITFNNYTFNITDDMKVDSPNITEHYDTMSSTAYNGYFILNIPITVDNKDYSIKLVKHFNTDSAVVDVGNYWNTNGNKYTIVEYLESTGTQYIDVQFIPNQDTKVEMNFTTTSGRTEGYFGSRVNYNVSTYSFIQDYNKFRSDYDDDWYQSTSSIINDLVGYPNFLIIKDKNKTTINNNIVILNGYGYFSSQNSLYIFSVNNNGVAKLYSKMKLYWFKVYDSDTLVRDFVPVIDSSNRPCLFDKVSKECYYNQGTGEFLYG